RGQPGQGGVVMLLVVPGEEADAERARVVEPTEPLREGRVVLQGPELALGERVVVADVGTAVTLGDPQPGQKMDYQPGLHGGAPVRVHGDLAWPDVLLGAALLDELRGEIGGLALGDHPT